MYPYYYRTPHQLPDQRFGFGLGWPLLLGGLIGGGIGFGLGALAPRPFYGYPGYGYPGMGYPGFGAPYYY